jgi:hypothetical protein
VSVLRVRGYALPDWFGRDPDVPRAVHAGPWIAQHGQFFDGLTQGAPADVVIYEADPRRDLSQLDRPRAVILRGRLILPGMGWAPVRKGVER